MPNEPEAAPQTDSVAELPTVSAVIPAYNAAETIERALNSVYAQTYPNIIEVIVVDDGSTDATAQIIRDKFPQVTLIQQENAGNAAARNTGVAAATGEFIAFLDADDEWLPEKIATQIGVMQGHPGIDLLLCAAVRVTPECFGNASTPAAPPVPHVTWFGFRQFLERALPPWLGIGFSAWCIRRELASEHCLDPAIRTAVDWEYLARLTGLGYSVAATTVPLYRYYILPDSVCHSDRGKLAMCQIHIDYIRRYDPSGEGWRSELLTPEEFRSALQEKYFVSAWILWHCGERERAHEYLRQASELSDARGLRAWRERLAAWNPSLYHALARTLNWGR